MTDWVWSFRSSCIVATILQATVSVYLIDTVNARPPRGDQLDESYSFERYMDDFSKTYESEADYVRRKATFQSNLAFILEHNRQPNKTYTMGINQFVDTEPPDVSFGLDRVSHRQMLQDDHDQHRRLLPFDVDDVSLLPPEVDWRQVGAATPIKDQGSCGSCWAFAAVTTIESHLFLESGMLFSLSVQEPVSCAPNPRECGGQGGCSGSTAELAFDFLSSHGIVEEWHYGYASHDGNEPSCAFPTNRTHRDVWTNSTLVEGAVATLNGWVATDDNDYAAVMNAVAKHGPIAVNVAAHEWNFYESGILTSGNKPSSFNINHVVVLMGYGTDDNTGLDYWLVRNSYGPRWGENGYIRLLRRDPHKTDSNERSRDPNYGIECGRDLTPLDGDECAIDTQGNPVPPRPIEVCGTSGIYYRAILPTGVRLL